MPVEVVGDAYLLVQEETVAVIEELALFDPDEWHREAVYPIVLDA